MIEVIKVLSAFWLFILPIFLLWRISDNISCIAQCLNDMNKRQHKKDFDPLED